MAKHKTKPAFDRKNLIVLVSNGGGVQAMRLNEMVFGSLIVDHKQGTFSIENLKFSIGATRIIDGYGILGVYDISDTEHQNRMLFMAQEIGRRQAAS